MPPSASSSAARSWSIYVSVDPENRPHIAACTYQNSSLSRSAVDIGPARRSR